MIIFYVYTGPLIHCLYGYVKKIEAIYRMPCLDVKVKRGLVYVRTHVKITRSCSRYFKRCNVRFHDLHITILEPGTNQPVI